MQSQILTGDCVEVMAGMDAASVDAIVTDPPYGLEFMGKEWDRLDWRDGGGFSKPGIGDRSTPWASFGGDTANATCETCGGRMRGARKCECETPDWRVKGEPMGRRDGNRAAGMQAFHARWATEAFRIAKPGAYLLAFGGTRTYHRLACAIEDAGWIIRDCLVWAYASGFPKSKALLKPAWEPIVMARKPGPLRELAIDACRIPASADDMGDPARFNGPVERGTYGRIERGGWLDGAPSGRWPANLILTDPIFDGDTPGVVGGGEASSGKMMPTEATVTSFFGEGDRFTTMETYGDTGTYSRFFLIPKADRAEREPVLGGLSGLDIGGELAFDDFNRNVGNTIGARRRNVHPTVKPLDLMRHLVRLVTPTGGLVLDPFLGSGTTALAAEMEGFRWLGIEKEPEYVAIAEARLNGTQRGLGLEVS